MQGRSFVGAALLTTLVASTSLTVVLAPRPAAADQVSDLKAQAREISQELVQEQLQIGAYQQQYSVATEKVAADARTVVQIRQQIGGEKRRIDDETRVVRNLAIVSYMDAGNELSGSDAVFTGDMERVELANEYISLSAGNIDTALDRLHATQRTLEVHLAALQQAQTEDRSQQAQQASDLGRAVSTEQQMESEQARVTGQLAVVVADQAAARAAAAAAAVAAARKAAAAASSTVTAPAPGSVSDPVLNPYLQCVVQEESGGNYAAVSPDGLYMGGFQFSQATWNLAAPAAGLPGLVGVRPNVASKAEQDTVAVALYALDGQRPWLGDRCNS
ncbi:MAG TPA: transglycosylase family protein [Acidimicrobiales bacterium]|nr:transglycosylase family protein [Acidimicrobiales bacterium]